MRPKQGAFDSKNLDEQLNYLAQHQITTGMLLLGNPGKNPFYQETAWLICINSRSRPLFFLLIGLHARITEASDGIVQHQHPVQGFTGRG